MKIKMNIKKQELKVQQILLPDQSTNVLLPLFLESVSAGFPSPADDYLESKLDLNKHIIKHPASTFFVRVTGDSMVNTGIYSGDILVVDRSLKPKDGNIVIAVVDGDLVVKKLAIVKNKIYLVPENPDYTEIEITSEMHFEVWGVVTTVIHSLI